MYFEGDIREMFMEEDNTFNIIREKSLMQWLDEIEKHDDIVVRDGVNLAREYFDYLQRKIKRLEEESDLKSEYIKKIKGKK